MQTVHAMRDRRNALCGMPLVRAIGNVATLDAKRAAMNEIAIPALMGGVWALPAPFVPVEGSRVRCDAPSIDEGIGMGQRGTVYGFVRHSTYHDREALVYLDCGRSAYFWVRDLFSAD